MSDFADSALTAGYSGIWATENKHDPFLMVAAAARRSRKLQIGIGVTALLARNPFTVAQMSWDLHYNTGENFVLGVCAHQDIHLSARLGLSPERKHERLVESIAAIREIWASWMEDREPEFRGRHFSISVCPVGYRPTTRLFTLPPVYLLCSTAEDLDIGCQCADGVFVHPTWTQAFLDIYVAPRLARGTRAAKSIPVIDGGIVATGLTAKGLIRSRQQARQRIGGYWLRGDYDSIYELTGVMTQVTRYRNAAAGGMVDWEASWLQDLYRTFVCEALVDDLPDAIECSRAAVVTGIFPNIVSDIPRLLPRHVVQSIFEVRRPAVQHEH